MDKYRMRSNLAWRKLYLVAGLLVFATLLLAQPSHAANRNHVFGNKVLLNKAPVSKAHVSKATPASNLRIEVNITEMSLTVWAGNKALQHYRHISIGSGGVSNVHYQGDESTPVGEYTVLWINRDSPFDTFIALNYPTRQHADIALQAGKLSLYEYQSIAQASRLQQRPPFNTPLGGRIGIHGIGLGDPRVHEVANWTNGCVALTNAEVRELSQWVHIGTHVSIHR